MVGKYKVITLCGSTRFKDQFLEAQKRLTLDGNIVISVGLFGHSGDDEVWTEGTKEMLDDMHKRKIDMADAIYVINVGGYIGSSTRSEIEYAKANGKEVRYLEDETKNDVQKPVKKKNNGNDVVIAMIALGLPIFPAAIIGLIFYLLYLGSDSVVFLVLLCATGLIYIIAAILFFHALKKGPSSKSSKASPGISGSSSADPDSAFLLGMIGGTVLDRTFFRKGEKDNDFLWQEKTRRDMMDEGYKDW